MSYKKKSFNIMITASHFPQNYNGFKFFYQGKKLSKEIEKKIEKKIYLKKKIKKFKPRIFKVFYDDYNNFINKKFNFTFSKKIIFDYSNGSAASFINNINFLKKSYKAAYKYNWKNINKNCGSNYLYKNFKSKYKKFDYCIAFDGDADRIVIAEKKYGLIESEKIALIFIKYLKNKNFKGFKKKSNVVGTNITNPWFAKNLPKYNFKYCNSKVGDRNVINKQMQKKAILGFETSGHFSFLNMMDGIYAAGMFLKIIQNDEGIIKKILKNKIDYKCKIIGVDKETLRTKKFFLKKVNNLSNLKIVKRKSIWNNYYKIYFFFKDNNLKNIKKILKIFPTNKIKIKFKN